VAPKFAGGKPSLDDLWIMQGSLCDLKCKHCYTGSSPTNDRLQQIAFNELEPHLVAAAAHGVERIYFTGGEAFVNEDVLRGRAERNEEFLRSLTFALEIAPVEILTNARRHIRAHYDALRKLHDRHGERLKVRVTLESPAAEAHDELRGKGTFVQTVETVRQLCEMGFVPVITAERPLLSIAGDPEIAAAFQALFALPVEVNMIDNLLEMGHRLVQLSHLGRTPSAEVFVTNNCFGILGKPPESLMCHFSRCIMKLDGRLRYYPCPVIYDDLRFDLGGTLQESWQPVYVAHKNCYDYCLKGGGASCRTRII
jgi:MoaA/NifB/PqqE/SkfB family radical SAM enzyme